MARIGSKGRAALLVVDVQNAVMKNAHDCAGVVSRIAELTQRARAAGVPVIYVQHTDDSELPQGSHGWQLVPELKAQAEDHRISKHFNSAFEETGLDALLHEMQVSEIILTGAATNWCIRATAYGALNRGYDLTLTADAHTCEDMDVSDEKTLFATDLILELNIGIQYIEYPGITTRVVKAAELVF